MKSVYQKRPRRKPNRLERKYRRLNDLLRNLAELATLLAPLGGWRKECCVASYTLENLEGLAKFTVAA